MGLAKSGLLTPAAVAAWVTLLAGACTFDDRTFPEKIVLPAEAGSPNPAGEPDASATGDAAGGQGSNPESPGGSLPVGVVGGSGICDEDGNCQCDAEAESCAPVPICADAGATCATTCPGCLIAGECVAPTALNSDNLCQICDPARDALGWSDNDGAECNDDLFCTTGDACSGGSCEGTPFECEDGVACNGISTCLEDSDSCSPDVNQCTNGGVCSVAARACVSTCTGCLISGVCLESGAEEAGNPCRVCDPARADDAYSAAVGKSCGAAASACSQRDTCDAQGACQPNDLTAGAACGDSSSSACDEADACDGRGVCQARRANNDTPCDDEQFCTTGDRCQGGSCVPTGSRNCGANQACSEAANQCQCQGCVVGGTCFASGATNANNPCQICDPGRSSTAFSANVGANCGSGPTTCSAQDTCDAQGACAPNHTAGACDDGQFCSVGDRCQNGSCTPTGNRDCGASQSCNETTNQCQCQGCAVGGTCFASGVLDPNNTCRICDPNRSATAFSANTGANCGSGPATCSAQDTCNAQGACAPNHTSVACNDGQFCTATDRCQDGACSGSGATCIANQTCNENTNQCVCAGGTLSCASPLGGNPNCSSWDFESGNVEGWEFDLATAGGADAHVGNLTSSNAVPAPRGSRSLAVRFQGTGNPGRTMVFIRVPLCAGGNSVNLSGRRLQALVRLVTDPGTNALTTGQGHLISLYTADEQFPFAGGDFSVDPATGGGTGPLGWHIVDVDLSEQFSTSADEATQLGFRFLVDSVWSGTVYVDDIRLI